MSKKIFKCYFFCFESFYGLCSKKIFVITSLVKKISKRKKEQTKKLGELRVSIKDREQNVNISTRRLGWEGVREIMIFLQKKTGTLPRNTYRNVNPFRMQRWQNYVL